MIKLENKKIEEKYYVEVLNNGLTVYLYPKNDYYRTYAIFSTKYGAMDLEFIPNGSDEFVNTPEGVAHFLEHKLFENEDHTDVSSIFASLGAEANAFTTAERTAYLFSTTSNVKKCVELLLDFVQNPYFEKEGIDSERGIIEQELLMYLDTPDNVLYYGILKCLYKNCLIRNELGGTVESIKEIDEDILYQCYNTFYHPSNMTIAIVGKFDLDEMISLIKENQSKKFFDPIREIKTKYIEEPNEVYEKMSYTNMEVTQPKIAIGLKINDTFENSYEMTKKGFALDILLDIYFDNASDIYDDLKKRKIINYSFGYESYFEKQYRHVLFTLDTDEPEVFQEELTKIIDQIRYQVVDEQKFKTIKKLVQALLIKRYNSLEYLGNVLTNLHSDNLTLFNGLEILEEITINDVNEVKKYFDINNLATFIIYPNNK